MANNYFQFKHFTVFQDGCSMKVGTDGTLLGAWADGGRQILDIGTGTGLIAMMMAQRFPDSLVDAIDIDEVACTQARENVLASDFADRIRVHHTALQTFDPTEAKRYDAIVCNPPFFENALKNPDRHKSTARHTDSLSYSDLFRSVGRLLSTDEGVFSVIIPSDCRLRFDEEATYAGFYPYQVTAVKTTPRKAPKRYLLSYRLQMKGLPQEDAFVIGDDTYRMLLGDFYLHL